MIIITQELKDTLIEAVQAEGWDEGFKAELVENLRAQALGPYDETQDVDPEPAWSADAGEYLEDSLSSLIEHYGVWHLAPELSTSLAGVEVNLREVFDHELSEDPIVCDPVFPAWPDADQFVGIGPAGTDRDWCVVRPMTSDDILDLTQGVTLIAYRLRWRRSR